MTSPAAVASIRDAARSVTADAPDALGLSRRPWRRRFAQLHVVATWLLLAAGATVTSHDAGLAVPDWPTSFGFLNPVIVYFLGLVRGLATFEHGHRVVAMAVGLLTIVETVWLWRTAERRAVRVLGVLLLAGVLVQGALGGVTVLLRLPPLTSVAHGLFAQTFFCLSIATAYVVSDEWRSARPKAAVAPGGRAIRRAALLAFAAVYVQLLLGAVVRHTVAKERVPTFLDVPVLVHTAFAVLVVAAVGLLAARACVTARAQPWLSRPALLAALLLVVQIVLGVLAIATRTDPAITVLHVVTGAAILGTCMLAVLRSFRRAGELAP